MSWRQDHVHRLALIPTPRLSFCVETVLVFLPFCRWHYVRSILVLIIQPCAICLCYFCMYILVCSASALGHTHLFFTLCRRNVGKRKAGRIEGDRPIPQNCGGLPNCAQLGCGDRRCPRKTPPRGPTPSGALPAPERKKLVLKRPNRKTPRVVSEEEDDDEDTEDGLITKRTRITTSTPPALPTPTPPPPPAPLQPVQAAPLAAAPIVIESSSPNYAEDPPSASTPFVSVGEGPPSTTSMLGPH